MQAPRAQGGELTEEQLREAQRGFTNLLFAKRFPRSWIEENAEDLLAQAHAEFCKRLIRGQKDETVGLLIVIAYRRAQNLLDAQRRRPPTCSIETAFHLPDESTPTPEEELIARDRQERIARAMRRLPDKDCKLLALVYFNGLSVRAAGRRLGWRKSAADDHHRAALARLRPLLGDRALLSPEIAIPAFAALASRHGSMPPSWSMWLEGAWESMREAFAPAGQWLGGLWGRLSPFAEPGNAAAISGAGRAAAGACGVAVAVCGLIAATGALGPGLAGSSSQPTKAKGAAHTASEHRVPAPVVPPASPEPPSAKEAGGGLASSKSRQTARRDQGRDSAPADSATQAVPEFGTEHDLVGPSPSPGSSAAPASPSPVRRAPSPSKEPSVTTGGGSSSGGDFGR
jgi:RNA polymerase sigma factor (sigma-70 family)